MYDEILFDVVDGVATICLNRPARLNALTARMTREILEVQATCTGADEVRCIVLTGAGRAFCAGQDLEELQSDMGPRSISEHLQSGHHRVVLGFRQLEKPVIAKIHGVAAGAGLGYALAADLRIVSEQARLIPAFIGIGLAPDSGVSWFLQRLLGPATAFEILVTGRQMDAVEADRLGLVNQVVAQEELDAVVGTLSTQFAEGPTRGIGLSKRVLNQVAALPLAAALDVEAQIQDIAAATEDHQEGVTAFLQKRKPQFKGR